METQVKVEMSKGSRFGGAWIIFLQSLTLQVEYGKIIYNVPDAFVLQ